MRTNFWLTIELFHFHLKVWSGVWENRVATKILIPGNRSHYYLSELTPVDLHNNRCPCYKPISLNFPQSESLPGKNYILESSVKGLSALKISFYYEELDLF